MMHGKIDLNLFFVLKAVYEEESITAAAKALHLTQPAVSHAMSRLRDKFDDELFVRHSRRMVPTPLCQSIIQPIKEALAHLESTLADPIDFDISRYKREIRLGLRDILESTFLPALIPELLQNAANITVTSRRVTRPELETALTNKELDIVIDALVPTGPDIRSTLVCDEHFVLICAKEHPILKDKTLANYVSASHVLVTLKDSRLDTVDLALAKQNATRQFALQCEHYFAAASVVSKSDLLLTVPSRYAQQITSSLPVAVTTLPFDVPLMPIHMYWHKQADEDLVNKWMREKLLALADELLF